MSNNFIGPVSGGGSTPVYDWVVNPDTMEYGQIQIDASVASDAGSHRSTYLRAGLALGQITATGLYAHYVPGETDGRETIAAILAEGVDLLDPFGTALTEDPASIKAAIKGHIDARNVILIDAAGKVDLRNAGFLLKEDYE